MLLVPDLKDFVAGMKEILKPEGVIVLEYPYLLNLVQDNLFDTISHEHYSYFSLAAICNRNPAPAIRTKGLGHF